MQRWSLYRLKCILAIALVNISFLFWQGKVIAAGVVVSGQVQNDLNSNGDVNEGDPGISGVRVTLFQDDGNGNPTGGAIATTTTDSNGVFSFPNVAIGNYILVETNPTNFVSSGDSQGANDDRIAISVGSFDRTGNIFLDVNTALLDYGDAPNTYSTTLASNGARHIRNGQLFLGSGVTGEADGQPNSTASADSFDDGVTFNPALGANYTNLIQAGIANTVAIESSGAGFLNAWVDYNQDGDFNDPGERIFTNRAVNAGINTLTLPVTPPNTLLHGLTYARFRLSPASISSPSVQDVITGGEVEDYLVNVANPIPDSASCTTTGLTNSEFSFPDINGSTPPWLQDFDNGNIKTYDEQNIPGWNTNASDGRIELWKSGALGTATYNNTGQFVEINANESAALFQDIATVPGSTLTWQFAHRAREGIDVMDVKAGSPNGVSLLRRVSTDTSGWVFYRGTYTVPAGQFITRFQFEAVSTGSGNTSIGNFIDAVQFSTNTCVTAIFPPTLDLDGNNSSGATGANFRGIFAGGGVSYRAADTDVTITDDKTNIASATIRLTTRPDGSSESLSINPTVGGIPSGTVIVNNTSDSNGQITLTGSTSLANYARILATLTYRNTVATPTGNRVISVQVIDTDGLRSNLALSTLSLTLPPTIDLDGNDSSGVGGSDYLNTFVVGAGAVSAADADVAIADDGANLRSATITLTNRPDFTVESLSLDPTAGGTVTGITATAYNPSNGQITLTGNTTLTNYQRVLSTLRYNNTAPNPNLTPRQITVSVVDTNNNLSSNTALSTLIIKTPPTLDLDNNNSSGATGNDYRNTFIATRGPVRAADVDVAITDEKNSIASATLTLMARPDGATESLSIDATAGGTVTGVTASAYNSSTGQLTLSGNATLNNYQEIIATLKYNNTTTTPNTSDRTIQVRLTDSDNLTSNIAVGTIQVQRLSATVLLVKRITEINGNRTQNPNAPSYKLNEILNSPGFAADDPFPTYNWPNNFLVGAYDAGPIKPGDIVEYTVYFMNAFGSDAANVRICDRIVGQQQFLNDGYGAGQDIEYKLGTNPIQYLTRAASTAVDRAELNSSTGTIAGCPAPSITGTNNGTVVIDITGSGSSGQQTLTTLPGATAQGMPSNSYGYFRFKTKVNP